ncbi:predicted coiled-coil structure containing protein [Malacoplasma penetrans HF-2]|uniref:Predicted coiled-coil structure containing protein n=1 Tax=Malacoplasma penetrans (strain HF-2) TaxID=272633 RepID=Q8EWP9_MALP2|nr:coiled-coil structure containing protein [Malacoplasma penetrans]BAC43945.1 predicted coiled-coil structure containing protein [Malacoplasma penetrans HF-2]
MNSRNVNNLTLNEKINRFKNKYTELLMQLDNSNFLNLTKFEDLEQFQGTDNIYSLLKENEKVSHNLQIIKESIKKKIINLQLLSSKTHDEDTIDAYGNLYDFDALNGGSLNNYLDTPSFSRKEILKISADIDSAMQKIDEISNFIENKVIPKLNKDEQEKKELTALLNDSQKKISELLVEKDIDQQSIKKLHQSNKDWENECNELVNFSVQINQKLISLEALIDENEKYTKEISEEKDNIIAHLEKKINDLLADIDSDNFFSFKDFDNRYNISDSFVSLISKIINNVFKSVYDIEKSFNAKIKEFNKCKSSLINKLTSSITRREHESSLISNITPQDAVYDVREESVEFANKLLSTQNTKDFTDYLANNFLAVFKKIDTSLFGLYNELNSTSLNDGEYFSKKSIRKINNLCIQISEYTEKNNLLFEQVDNFIKLLTSDFSAATFALINFDSFWWDAACGYKQILEKFFNDFSSLNKMIKAFFEYIGMLSTNPNQFVNFEQEFSDIVYETQNPNNGNEEILSFSDNAFDPNEFIYTPVENEEVFVPFDSSETVQEIEEVKEPHPVVEEVNKLIEETDDGFNKYDYDHDAEISNIVNQVDFDSNEQHGNIDDLKPELDYSFLNNSKEEPSQENYEDKYLNTNIYSKDFDAYVNEIEKQEEMFDFDNLDDINSINEFNQSIKDLDSLDKRISDLLDEQDPSLENQSDDYNNQIQDFNSFVKKIVKDLEYKTNLTSSQKILLKNELYKIFSDEETTVKEKLIQLEEFLIKVFEKEYYTKLFQYWIIAFKKYLLEKKYNINLKLRIVKSKFNKLKMLIELERDKNYLSLFNDE